MSALPITDYVFSEHARFELLRRGLSEEAVRVVLQSKVLLEPPGTVFLLRVFVDVDRCPAEVVTVYRTSKVEKYWRNR